MDEAATARVTGVAHVFEGQQMIFYVWRDATLRARRLSDLAGRVITRRCCTSARSSAWAVAWRSGTGMVVWPDVKN